MPNTDFISKLLEIKDLIVDEIENSSTSTHIFFHLERRDHVCPHFLGMHLQFRLQPATVAYQLIFL